jgi:hypothetical protein
MTIMINLKEYARVGIIGVLVGIIGVALSACAATATKQDGDSSIKVHTGAPKSGDMIPRPVDDRRL